MTSRDFAYWLQGFFEIQGNDGSLVITSKQTDIIKKHLNLVFKHEIDPSMGDEKHQNELNEIHNKPTLEELGKILEFEVYDKKEGTNPKSKNILGVHGWYNPDEESIRC